MKTASLFSTALLVAVASGPLAFAQDSASPAPAPAATVNVAEPAVINHVVYLASLPTPAELMKSAEARATPIARMDQTTDRIVVTYQYAGGRTITFAYVLLSSAASAPAPVATETSATSGSPQVVVRTAAPATTVVYAEPETVYYSSPRYVRYYDPAWDFWAPLAVGVGLGWVGGHNSWYGHGHGHGYGYGYGHGYGHGSSRGHGGGRGGSRR